MVAVIRPKPTLERENISTSIKANIYTDGSTFGRNPIT
jgi:hypothetical protein